MKSTWKLFGMLFVCLSPVLGLTACEEDLNGENQNQNEGDACEMDEDCAGDDLCVNAQCMFSCEVEGDCLDDEVCVDRPDGGEGRVCMIDDDDTCSDDTDCEGDDICVSSECRVTCEEHEECADVEICAERPDEGDEKICTDSDVDTYFTVLIEDITNDPNLGDPDRCGDTTYGYATSGVKVFDIILWQGNDVVAHADAVDFQAGTHDDQGEAFFGDASLIFNGSAPDFEHICPDPESFNRLDNDNEVISTFHEDAVLALGCGGQLFVQFLDEDFNPRPLDESHEIEVYTYGQTCSDEMFAEHDGEINVTQNPQSTDDPYDVYLCTYGGTTGPVDADESCDIRLTEDPARGFGLFEVEIF